jgi:hypothetical protein
MDKYYRNIEKIILRAYVWLCNHFNEDDTGVDEIYLFGMSTNRRAHRAMQCYSYSH